METINNVAQGVSKAIWGEQNETAGQEPISGRQGKGTVNEPYDQGNKENPTQAPTTSDNTPSTSTSGNTLATTGPPIATEPPHPTPASERPDLTSASDRTESTPTSKPIDDTPTSNMSDTTRAANSAPNNPVNAATGGEPNPLQNTDKTGVVAGRMGDSKIAGGIIPSESSSNPGAAPASGGPPEFKQQGADKPTEAPSGEEAGAIKDTKQQAEELMKKRDPNDHSGEPMHMHVGPEKNAIPATQAERRESKVGNPGGQEHGKEPKGTGEQWVKTSGMASEGGDFDATKAGAGREADRLMEEKGIRKTASGPTETSPAPVGGTEKEKEKVSVGAKIKDKLHIGHKDK